MTIKEILEELISQGWFGKVTGRTEGNFFDDKEDVDREVNKALARLKSAMMECLVFKNCSNPNYRPAEYVTHDMAIDAEDRSLEGSLYRAEEYEQCGGCPECIHNQFLTETKARMEEVFK